MSRRAMHCQQQFYFKILLSIGIFSTNGVTIGDISLSTSIEAINAIVKISNKKFFRAFSPRLLNQLASIFTIAMAIKYVNKNQIAKIPTRNNSGEKIETK